MKIVFETPSVAPHWAALAQFVESRREMAPHVSLRVGARGVRLLDSKARELPLLAEPVAFTDSRLCEPAGRLAFVDWLDARFRENAAQLARQEQAPELTISGSDL